MTKGKGTKKKQRTTKHYTLKLKSEHKPRRSFYKHNDATDTESCISK